MIIPKKPIVCCGLTPCIQRILEFMHVEKGAVNRAVKVTRGIGGKGANTARMINQLGGDCLLVGFAGGANGELLGEMLSAEGVAFTHLETAGETRICQTLVEAGHPETTELVEEMPAIAAAEWEAMLDLFRSMELADVVVPISGKLPAGAPVDAYGQIAAIVQEQGGIVIIDAPGEPLRSTLPYEPYMVKINDVELLQTVPGKDLIDACRQLLGMGARSVLITRGAKTAFFVDELQTLEISPPQIEAVNPVGSGDAVTAGIALAVSKGAVQQEILIDGMACGSANALNLKSGSLKRDDIDRLRREVKIKIVE